MVKAGARLMRKRFFSREFIQTPRNLVTPVSWGCGCRYCDPELWLSKEDAIEALEEYKQILKENTSEVEKRI
ncbi:hypothetical protein [Stygiobacter electus]|uniref:Uncharacterized protein n=1 Tax=Stygiobacter electus TaxID=3032292 RepID=A0AAE3P2C0_9BACT|nr:hypothetical protein [Stygiobacter electus]MDF1613109.1 hypothetical protein [Stygiobacter electus]